MKRILFLGDTHCGHISGLTPPAWRVSKERCEMIGQDWHSVQETCWNTYLKYIEELKPIHGICVGGDCGDGLQKKQNGLELIVTDEEEQAQMAYECIKKADAQNHACVVGTPYHIGPQYIIDKLVASKLNAPIDNTMDVLVNGCRIRFRHKIGGTQTPVGGDIALRKKDINDLIWKEEHGLPKADLQAFFHVHRWRMIDMKIFSCPALQAWTSFGSRQCESIIHWGLFAVDINDDGAPVQFHKKFMRLVTVKTNRDQTW